MNDTIQNDIIAEFDGLADWMDKYDYLISLGQELSPMNPQHRTDRYLINGCQSRVWVDAELDGDGKMVFSADSDAIITKGIIALLIRVMNGRTPREVMELDLYFIDATGLSENLSPTRSNGLTAMVKQMRMYALAFDSAKNKNDQ